MSDICKPEVCEREQQIDHDALFENVVNQARDMTMDQKQELLKARRETAFPWGAWIYCAPDRGSNGKPMIRVHFFEEYPDGLVEYEQFMFSKTRKFGNGKEAYFLYAFRYADTKNIVYEGGFQKFLSGLSMSLTWKFLNTLHDDWEENPYFIPWLYYYWVESGGLRERLFASINTGRFAVRLSRFKGLRYNKHEFPDVFELPQACLDSINELYIESILERDTRIKVAALYERYKDVLSTEPWRRTTGIELMIEAVREDYPEEEIEKCLLFIRDKLCDEDNSCEYYYYLAHRRKLPQFQRVTVMPADFTHDACESISQAYNCLAGDDRDNYSARFRLYQNVYHKYVFENESYQVKVPDSMDALWNAGLDLNLGIHDAFDEIYRGDLFVFFLFSKDIAVSGPVGLFAVRRNNILWSARKDNQPLTEDERSFLTDYALAHQLELGSSRYRVNDLLEERL